jgi:dolichyl-phosphate-mannose-protein mannosyltransferase
MNKLGNKLLWHLFTSLQGQFFSGNDVRIYLLGNPIIWWGNLLLMGLYLVLFAVVEIREKRGVILSPEQHSKCQITSPLIHF